MPNAGRQTKGRYHTFEIKIYIMMHTKGILVIVTILCSISCRFTHKEKSAGKKPITEINSTFRKGEYGYDLAFLREHLQPVELVDGDSRLILIPEYQGRVMTSSSAGKNGFSYGWINYDLISSKNILENFNPYGGEERIWLGPEGGQFALFFEEGAPFNIEKWIVPAALDREPFEIDSKNARSVTMGRTIELKNYSGTVFQTRVTRKVTLLNSSQIDDLLGINYDKSVKAVAYQSENILKNIGNSIWSKETGALSVWMLSMLNASPDVTVVLPYKNGDYGRIVKDDYLGVIPEERLKVTEVAVFFRADGKFRSKIGISPQRALPFMGSYDIKNKILTILEYSLPPNVTDYVNSALEIQEDPYSGDVINSYNDGSGKDGSQMGLYYELEASSPAAFLKPGEEIIHTQRIYHFEGSEKALNVLTKTILGVSIEEIKNAFR